MGSQPAPARPVAPSPHLARDWLASCLRPAIAGLPGPPPLRVFLWQLLEERLLPEAEQEGVSLLPILVCQACGGVANEAASVTAAWQLVRLSAKMLDDIEDAQCDHAVGPLVNAAVAMLTLAQVVLQRIPPPLSKAQSARLATGLQRALLGAAAGQHVDLTTGAEPGPNRLSPAGWLRVASAKTGALLAWAAAAGAIAAAAPHPVVTAYRAYGRHLGVLLQLADDFNDAWLEEPPNDLTEGCLNLATCYAMWVGSESQVSLLGKQLQAAQAGHPAALAAARGLLVDLGAQAYFVAVGQLHRQQASAALQRAAPGSVQAGLVLRDLVGRTFPDPLARGLG
jgi:geranylgeranyl pyrophosphate synthase